MAWVSCTPEKFVRLMVLEDGEDKGGGAISGERLVLCIITRPMAFHGVRNGCELLSKTELTFVTKQH